ncbi:MAG: hypothetical protein M0R38_10320 [Bacteroidia bacterium]|nr:hypothetical protein [Bacteroidia bacterium]
MEQLSPENLKKWNTLQYRFRNYLALRYKLADEEIKDVNAWIEVHLDFYIKNYKPLKKYKKSGPYKKRV